MLGRSAAALVVIAAEVAPEEVVGSVLVSVPQPTSEMPTPTATKPAKSFLMRGLAFRVVGPCPHLDTEATHRPACFAAKPEMLWASGEFRRATRRTGAPPRSAARRCRR